MSSKIIIILLIIINIITIIFSLKTSYAVGENQYLYASTNVRYNNTESGIVATDVQGAVDELYTCATDYVTYNTNIKNELYPIGSLYISTNNTNPSTIIGGTWISFGEGRTLVGVGTGTDDNSVEKVFASNETGGEYSHTLTIAEMPSHNHYSGAASYIGGSQYGWVPGLQAGNRIAYSEWSTGSTGGNEAHNNVQPYITVYMWKRTA